ncbi:MAG: prephenate dehydrogenase/arogenate dehydrogenase family protein [Desulfurococcales archaeon]|nr:prephenate dehydrogenase/arogenate dehydrogenase family protein [Desulfurococcales archaeon]
MEIRVIGSVGAGRMALTLARLLNPYGFEFTFYDVNHESLAKARKLGYRVYKELSEMIRVADAIMISVSHSNYREAIHTVKEELLSNPNRMAKLVFDIASFKEDLLKEYQEYPDDVMVGSIHPLFGPGARDPKHHTVAVIPVPGREGSRILADVFKRAGFKVVVVDAESHDELVSYTIGASYLIAVALARAIESEWERIGELSGTSFKLLKILIGSIANDQADFISHVLSRPGTRSVADRLINAIADSIRDPQSSAEKIKSLIRGGAGLYYEKLYDCIER